MSSYHRIVRQQSVAAPPLVTRLRYRVMGARIDQRYLPWVEADVHQPDWRLRFGLGRASLPTVSLLLGLLPSALISHRFIGWLVVVPFGATLAPLFYLNA